MANIVLQGITWNHSRGISPLLAASQRFQELNPNIEIKWNKRSLQQFADYPIEKLTETYDLLIIDHPWVGTAAATNCVLALDDYLPPDYIQNQLSNSVGFSHLSYYYNNHQWALAIDAAAPFSSYRKDLFEKHQAELPQTWESVLELARLGKVAAPAIPIDLLMNFYSFCIAQGHYPFLSQEEVISESIGVEVLETMRSFYSLLDRSMFEKNPIAVAEIMTDTDDYWYCPFAYGYSNYGRMGYAKHQLHYTDLFTLNGSKFCTTIGGTGLAVSAFSKEASAALAFVEMVCSEKIQSTLYVQNGGQSGHLAGWTDPLANQLTANFFENNLLAMKRGYVRPRYHGYLAFQDQAGEPIQEYLMGKNQDARSVIKQINQLYQSSLAEKQELVLK